MSPTALRSAINKIWDIPGALKFIPLGRGYYMINLISHIERERLLARRIWNFEFGTVKVQRWTPEFNPYKVTRLSRMYGYTFMSFLQNTFMNL